MCLVIGVNGTTSLLSGWTHDDLLKTLALMGAALAFLVGLAQYRRAQEWKRAEWVAQEMKHLFSDPLVQAALLMIDWGSRHIPLYPDHKDYEKRKVPLTDGQMAKALMSHRDRQTEPFSELESDIRAAFDHLLDGIERFSYYVQTGLVTQNHLEPYLKYWANAICHNAGRSGNEERLAQLCKYMQEYGFGNALNLLQHIANADSSSNAVNCQRKR